MERVVLDTGVLVASERGVLDLTSAIGDEDDVLVPAIVVAEFLVGVYRAPNEKQRTERREFLDGLLATIPVEDYTTAVAECHAHLLAHVREVGKPRGAHDLIVAATALSAHATVLTTDARARLDELPGVVVRVVEPAPTTARPILEQGRPRAATT